MQDIIKDLQAKLDDLNTQYHECKYSEAELDSLRNNARAFHNTQDQFTCQSPRHLILTLIEKLSQRYSYEDSDTACWEYKSGLIFLNLHRPVDILQDEYRGIDAKVETDYLKSIEETKSRLLEEIARTKLSLRDAHLDVSERERRMAEFNQLLQQTEAELTGKVEESWPNASTAKGSKPKGSTGA